MTNQINQTEKMDKTELRKIAETCVQMVKNGGVLEQAQLKADEKIAEQAANGDLDAIKLLNERMQDREEQIGRAHV